MASESDEEKIKPVSDLDEMSPGVVLRAMHAYNMVLGMDMGEQRRALLQGIYTFSGQTEPSDEQAEQFLARGPVASLRDLPALSDDETRSWVRVFGGEDLGLTLQALLKTLTGLPAATEEGLTPAPAVMAPKTSTKPSEPTKPRTAAGRWDVVFCAYDVVRRCHRLTLLRAGAWVESEPVAPGAEWAARDPDAEGLLSPLLDMPLSFDEQEHLLESAAAFTTPPCPDQEALIERLLQAHGPLDHLYLLSFDQQLPNPACVEQRFETQEAGTQGRPQRLYRQYRYRPAGLGISDVTTEISTRWDSRAQLQARGQEEPFRPMLLQLGPLEAVQMAAGWQVRAGWQARLTPLVGGDDLPVRIVSSVSGRLRLQAQGKFQEQFSLGSGQVAAINDGDRCVLHSGTSKPEAMSWPAGISLGAGDLTVMLGDIEVSLAGAREVLEQELRPVPNVIPQMDYTHRWSVSSAAEGAQALQGSLIVEQTARTRDARMSSQVRASAQASADARCGLSIQIGDPGLSIVISEDPGPGQELVSDGPALRVWEHPGAGHIQIGDGPRWAIRWRVQEQQRSMSWSIPIDIINTSAWGTSTERIHDPVDTSNQMTVVQVAAGYWLEPYATEE